MKAIAMKEDFLSRNILNCKYFTSNIFVSNRTKLFSEYLNSGLFSNFEML